MEKFSTNCNHASISAESPLQKFITIYRSNVYIGEKQQKTIVVVIHLSVVAVVVVVTVALNILFLLR